MPEERIVNIALGFQEFGQLSLNVAASHTAMLNFLEEAKVPWSDNQMVEFARLSFAERIALNAFQTSVCNLEGRPSKPSQLRIAADQLAVRRACAGSAHSRPWPSAFRPHTPVK